MLDGKIPENDCSVYYHSNGIHYDVVLDVNADDSTEKKRGHRRKMVLQKQRIKYQHHKMIFIN